jgi:hypothetical protein
MTSHDAIVQLLLIAIPVLLLALIDEPCPGPLENASGPAGHDEPGRVRRAGAEG